MPTARSYVDPTTSFFTVHGYAAAPPFSSFLPGIAGKWGIPLWCFYVNRGQAVCSFGVRDKDHQILEFQSFNQACMRIDREGFRTFLRLDGDEVYEPFRKSDDPRVEQTMLIAPAELTLRERNPVVGIETEVTYFGLPNLRVAGLVRSVRIKNLKRKRRRVEWLDGLPRILPHGLDQQRIKGIPRHVEGMMGVFEKSGVAVYRLKQSADDSERVGMLEGGHYFLRIGRGDVQGLIVDPEAVFGEAFSYDVPRRFSAGGLRAVLQAAQCWENKTPAALSGQTATLEPGAHTELATIFGYAERDRDLEALVAKTRRPGFLDEKRQENERTVEEIADLAFTASASRELDAYSRQDFLDNVLRGGMPLTLQCRDGKSAVYLYSRQNGDLERDYHHFVLEPTYLSQGTGHYRSVLQNRRTDAWFFPETEDANLRSFMGLIQLDGYNPLEVLGVSYHVADRAQAEAWAERRIAPRERGSLLEWMAAGFTPGALVMRLEDLGFDAERRLGALEEVLLFCEEDELGALHEGFWVDHWHYNFDLLEVLLMVHPDKLDEFLLGRPRYGYFDNPDVVVTRSENACDVGGKIRAYGAVVRSPDKLARLRQRSDRRHAMRSDHGAGEIYRTTLLVKLLTIVVNRLATLDAEGTGVEMEAGKPGWNDSMNGLPGLFGSGLSEALELGRAIEMLEGCLGRLKGASTRGVLVYEELAELMRALEPEMKRAASTRSPRASLTYWSRSSSLKEAYREQTRFGVSGREVRVPLREIAAFLRAGQALLERSFSGKNRQKVLSKSGVPHTYFVNDVTDYEPTGEKSPLGHPTVEPLAFQQRPTKLFLEGSVHWMKHRRAEAKAVYDAVAASPLFDRKLKMYKSCENMRGESPELGRAVGAYPRGWIENESIYLHMEYKYLLEVLRAGLCAEFWHDAKRALIPFMDPAVYGRSTLEGASFIVSSAYVDPALHGRAFQPRLSGITCEYLHMWILAVAGEHPLRLDRQGKLELALEPRLPGWLFTVEETQRPYFDPRDGWTQLRVPANAFAYKLFGHTLVVYDNASRKDTFGRGAARPRSYQLAYRSGRTARVAAATLPAAHARAVRGGDVSRIDVVLR
ncbi:MAG: hypothetical protein HS104_08010 [Polyangiaceae bacterium]|nr:hypothetical protein [Polyangiaceae bacterium]MCL4749306.1 hypothetical protein [Myxococcales bacterium]